MAAVARRVALGSIRTGTGASISTGITRAHASFSPALCEYRPLAAASHLSAVGLPRARLGGAFALKRWKSSKDGSTPSDESINLRPPSSPRDDPMKDKRYLDMPMRDADGPLSEVRHWKFNDVIEEVEKQKKGESSVVFVDVRELPELQETGWIPGAIHIPIVSSVQSFHLSDEDFMDMMGYSRPSTDTPIVLYCKAGVRARNAAGLAISAGYRRVGVYVGSWDDWANQKGPVSRDTSHYQVAPTQPKAVELDPYAEGPQPSESESGYGVVDYEAEARPKGVSRNAIAPMDEAYGQSARRKSSAYLPDAPVSDGYVRQHKPPARRGLNRAMKLRRPGGGPPKPYS